MPPRKAKKSAGPKRAPVSVRVVVAAVKDKPIPPTQPPPPPRRRRQVVYKEETVKKKKKIQVVEEKKKKIVFEESVLVFGKQPMEPEEEEEEEEEEPSETTEPQEEEEEPSESDPQVEEEEEEEEEEEPSETEPQEEEEEPSETEPEWKQEEEDPSETEPQEEEEEPSETTEPELIEEEEEEEPETSRYVSLEEEDNVKESSDEDDKDERLEPEDSEVEYEPEEDISLDYDEKEIEDEHVEEEGYGGGKEAEEEVVGEEEEDDSVEEHMEDVPEEIQDEDEENAVEEHEVVVNRENEEHHEVVKERRKAKEFEVFVGGLDRDATKDDLKKIFSVVGEITEVKLMMNPQTKKNKGFAFLRFATVEQAKRAVTEMKKTVVNGKQCGVSPCQDRDTLFLGNICKTWTKEALKEKLKHYGISNVEDFTLIEDSISEGMNRGFAFLEFSSRLEAMNALKRLQKRDVVFGVDRNARVAFANSFSEPDDGIRAQVKRVFVDGLPVSWDEDRVKNHLKSFGEIQKIELARNKPSAKRKDYGYVTFGSHNEAVACAEAINKSELGEGDNKKKVRAILAKPGQRVRQKHDDRGDFRPGRRIPHGIRDSRVRPPSSSFSVRGSRGNGTRFAPPHGRGFKGPSGFRARRPVMVKPERAGPLPSPVRSYSRRPIPSYPKSSSKRAYSRKGELSPRSRAAVDYDTRAPKERTSSYHDEYFSRGSGYSDEMPHTGSPTTSRSRAAVDYDTRAPKERTSSYHNEYFSRGSGYSDEMPHTGSPTTSRREYADESYDRGFERPPPSYRKGHSRDYDYIPGSKRQYSALDDVPPRYADGRARQSRARLDYGVGGSSSSQYVDTSRERLGRSHLGGYGGSRSYLSVQESHGIYGSRRTMGYGEGSSGGNDDRGTYSSSLGSEYMSQGPDVGDSSYSPSLYSSRSLGGSSYLRNGGSGSYY